MAGVDFLSSLALFKQVSTQQIANRKSYLLWFLVWISKVLLKHYKYQMQIMQYHCFRFLLGSPLESWKGVSWGNLTSNLQQPTINSELKKLLEQHFGTISNLMFWMFCFLIIFGLPKIRSILGQCTGFVHNCFQSNVPMNWITSAAIMFWRSVTESTGKASF